MPNLSVADLLDILRALHAGEERPVDLRECQEQSQDVAVAGCGGGTARRLPAYAVERLTAGREEELAF